MAEELGRICFEACPEALMIVRDGLVVRVNEEMCRLLGIRAGSEAEGRRIEEIIPMDLDNRVGLHAALSRILPGDVRAYEWELSLPGAVYIPVIIRATGLGGGGLLLSLRDFTEGQQRNRAILDHEEQRRALLEATGNPVFCVDREFRILWCSGSFGAIAGERSGALAGRQCHRMLGGLDSPCPGCPAIQAMRTRSVLSNAPCAQGRDLRVSVSSFRGYDGSPAGAVLTILAGSPASGSPPARPAEASGGGPGDSGDAPDSARRSRPAAPATDAAVRRDLDVTGWLNSSVSRLESILGSPLEILAPVGPARACVTPEDLLETFNNLAGADFGTCLPESSGITVRVDRAELPAGQHGMAAGRYLSVSLGTRLALDSADCTSLPGGRHNRLSTFPMNMNAAIRGGGTSGAVFVSRADGDRRFYQIMIPVSDKGR